MFFHEIIILFAIIPIILIPIESIIPYACIVEEIVKFGLVFGLAKTKKNHLVAPLLAGFLFNLTETFLYIPNIIKIGDPTLLIKRLLITGFMHMFTTTLMYLGVRKNIYFGILSLIIATSIHCLFNYLFSYVR